MIEVRRWFTIDKGYDTDHWHMVQRVKSFDELREDLKPEIAMIDAADERDVAGIGYRTENFYNGQTTSYTYWLDDTHRVT